MSDTTIARPLQAALASAAGFAVAAVPPMLVALLWQATSLSTAVVGTSLLMLAVLGGAARLGRAPLGVAIIRGTF